MVRTHGAVTTKDVEYARGKIAALTGVVRFPVLFAKVDLVVHGDPARERPASAKAELDLNGRVVRAHATAAAVPEAVDLLQARLRDRIDRASNRQISVQRRHRDAGREHEWHHGDPPTRRPDWFPRPADEREIVRRKSFAIGTRTPGEAALDLEQLDHDFYLFTDAGTGAEALVHRVGDGRYELVEPSPLTVEQAIERLDAGGEAFTFFRDPDTGRGSVAYRRHDGHVGLITPADASE